MHDDSASAQGAYKRVSNDTAQARMILKVLETCLGDDCVVNYAPSLIGEHTQRSRAIFNAVDVPDHQLLQEWYGILAL